VHLEHVGHPLLGDKMYGQPDHVFLHLLDHGPDEQVRSATSFPRQALHAHRLVLPHPDGTSLEILAPLAPDMRSILDGESPCWPLSGE
jgi:23S rRNA pseudouridine1911/1915/1917 synthase